MMLAPSHVCLYHFTLTYMHRGNFTNLRIVTCTIVFTVRLPSLPKLFDDICNVSTFPPLTLPIHMKFKISIIDTAGPATSEHTMGLHLRQPTHDFFTFRIAGYVFTTLFHTSFARVFECWIILGDSSLAACKSCFRRKFQQE